VCVCVCVCVWGGAGGCSEQGCCKAAGMACVSACVFKERMDAGCASACCDNLTGFQETDIAPMVSLGVRRGQFCQARGLYLDKPRAAALQVMVGGPGREGGHWPAEL
jgi:hypothetical protein